MHVNFLKTTEVIKILLYTIMMLKTASTLSNAVMLSDAVF